MSEFNLANQQCDLPAKQSKLESFVTRTSADDKKRFDIQVAKYMYATNTAFKQVEHPEFKKMIEMLHPGYTLPTRQQIENELLNKVYEVEIGKIKQNLRNKVVCMAQDGWSNIHNEPILCTTVTDVIEEKVYLCDTINTEDKSHTADYLLDVATESIKSCRKYGCFVKSFVTDNASNMKKMREKLARSEELGLSDILTYGCSAHILNLLAQDLEIPNVKAHVKKIMKYFRNTHFAAAKYKQNGGKSLTLPQDVRWNTLADCLRSYLDNWHILSKVCSENRAGLDSNIISKVNDIELKIKVEDYLKKIQTVSVALDKVQKDCCTIGEAANIWIHLLKEFQEDGIEADVTLVKKRFEMAMTPAHFLGNIRSSLLW